MSPRTSFWGAHESYAGFLTVLACTVLFFGTVLLCRSTADCKVLPLAAVVAAAVASVYALMQVAHLDPISWQRISDFHGYTRPFATLGHPNFLAAYLVMVWPFLLYQAGSAAGQRRSAVCVLFGVVAVLAVAAIGLSLSRGGWLALAGATIVLVFGWGWNARNRRVVLLGGGLMVASICFIGTALAFSGKSELARRFGERFSEMTEMSGRRYIWKAGWSIFEDHPVCGCGLDAFQLAFPAKREVGFWEIEWNATPSKAHNELLHILATQGLVGMAALGILLWGIGRAMFRVWRQEESRSFLIALTAGMVGFGIQDLFSFTVVGCGTLFVTMAAVLQRLESAPLALSSDHARRSPSHGKPTALLILHTGIVVATAALIYWGVVRPWMANRDCGRAEALLDTAPEEAIPLAEHALNLDDTKEVSWVQLGAACEKAAWGAKDATARKQALTRARRAFEHAVRMVPVSAYNHANLGRVFGELAESADAAPAEAFAEFDLALGLDPTNVYFYADAGLTAVRLGDCSHARCYAERGLVLRPNFAPLHAQLGYVAIIERRWPDAIAQLNAALDGEWYGDDEEHRRAALALGALHESLRCAPAPSE